MASKVFCTISFVLSWVISHSSEIAFTISFLVTKIVSRERFSESSSAAADLTQLYDCERLTVKTVQLASRQSTPECGSHRIMISDWDVKEQMLARKERTHAPVIDSI
jgi:hypothetical protein